MDMQIFENAQFGVVRATEIDGEPWFVAKDVCDALGLGNSRQALSRLDDDEKDTVILNDSIPGNPNKAVVNEPGLYSLIMSSRKPEAKAFKRWVTHEVLPSIHRDGAYVATDGTEDDMLLMARALKAADRSMKRKDAMIAELQPKALVADAVFAPSRRHARVRVKSLPTGAVRLLGRLLFRAFKTRSPYPSDIPNRRKTLHFVHFMGL